MVEAFLVLPRHDLVLAPSALGGHIDHRLVRQAAQQAVGASSLVFYEDLPYACRMTSAEREAVTPGYGSLCEAWLGDTALRGWKRDYALCYPSQIARDVAEEMERYAQEHAVRECFIGTPDALGKLQAALQSKEAAA